MPGSCGLVTYVAGVARGPEEPDPEMRVPGWFCPDMLFVNERWEPLSVGGGGGDMPVTLAGIVSLLITHIHVTDTENRDVPWAFWELHHLMAETGMLGLHRADRLTPLILARSRVCTNSRATVIMSVTGATIWHLGQKVEKFKANAKAEAEENLVCFGLYPLAFVDELRRKVGGSFFTYNHSVATLTTTDGIAAVDRVLRGSMLPFMPGYQGHIVSDEIGLSSCATPTILPCVVGRSERMAASGSRLWVGMCCEDCPTISRMNTGFPPYPCGINEFVTQAHPGERSVTIWQMKKPRACGGANPGAIYAVGDRGKVPRTNETMATGWKARVCNSVWPVVVGCNTEALSLHQRDTARVRGR